MNTNRSIDDIMKEMNAQAKAQGRFLGKAFWEVPAAEGSILDTPPTPEAQQRLADLRERRRRRRGKEQTSSTAEHPAVALPAQANPIDQSQETPANP